MFKTLAASGFSGAVEGLETSTAADHPYTLPHAPNGAVESYEDFQALGTTGALWQAQVEIGLRDQLNVPSAAEISQMSPTEVDTLIETTTSQINEAADEIVKGFSADQSFLRSTAMHILEGQTLEFLSTIENASVLGKDGASSTEILAERHGLFPNITNGDVIYQGMGWDDLTDPNNPIAAYDTDKLKAQDQYNYFVKLEANEPPPENVVDTIKSVFGDHLPNDITVGTIDDPSMTFRGANDAGVPVVHPSNIEIAAGGDPAQTQADIESVMVNELAHSVIDQILGGDASLADATWFNDHPKFGVDGEYPTPSNLEFNEFASDVASTAHDPNAFIRVVNNADLDADRYGFSRGIALDYLSEQLPNADIDSIASAPEGDRLTLLTEAAEADGLSYTELVDGYLSKSTELLQSMISHAETAGLQPL